MHEDVFLNWISGQYSTWCYYLVDEVAVATSTDVDCVTSNKLDFNVSNVAVQLSPERRSTTVTEHKRECCNHQNDLTSVSGTRHGCQATQLAQVLKDGHWKQQSTMISKLLDGEKVTGNKEITCLSIASCNLLSYSQMLTLLSIDYCRYSTHTSQ